MTLVGRVQESLYGDIRLLLLGKQKAMIAPTAM